MTGVFIKIFRLLIIGIVSSPGKYERPGFGVRRRVIDCNNVLDRPRIDLRETLREPHVALGNSSPAIRRRVESLFVGKIRRLHNQRMPLPMSARIPIPQPDFLIDMRTIIQRNDANVMHTLVMNHDLSWTLQNLNSVVVCLSASWYRASDTTCVSGMIRPGVESSLLPDQPRGIRSVDICSQLLCPFAVGRHAAIFRIDD